MGFPFENFVSRTNLKSLFMIFILFLSLQFQNKIFFFNFRRFGTKCGICSQGICPTDLVRRARGRVYHVACFTCLLCHKQPSTGEELYVLDETKFVCKEDFNRHQQQHGKLLLLLFLFYHCDFKNFLCKPLPSSIRGEKCV